MNSKSSMTLLLLISIYVLFLDYHWDDQIDSDAHYWGCTNVGGFYTETIEHPTKCGLFYNWKMCGTYYDGYANYRVSSRLSKN